MEYFKCISKNIDPAPLLKEISANEELFLENHARQEAVPAHRQTENIVLRRLVPQKNMPNDENQESEWTERSQKFPLICGLLKTVAEKLDGTLSRANVVRLEPKGNVYLHIDHGSYYFVRDRYHLILQSKSGSHMMAGGEKALMKEGELWWFQNNQYHQAMNNSDDWRIHVIFDILPNKYAHFGKNALSVVEIDKKLNPPAD